MNICNNMLHVVLCEYFCIKDEMKIIVKLMSSLLFQGFIPF